MAASTRKKQDLYLLGQPIMNVLDGCKLPSKGEVMRRFLHLHLSEGMTIRDSQRKSVREVISFWEKARIPTRQEYNIIAKLDMVFKHWQKLKKGAKRESKSQKDNEAAFMSDNDDLFDIAHAKALEMIKIEEDKVFLKAQRQKG